MYEANSFNIKHQLQLPLGDPYLAEIRRLWEESLNQAFEQMPNIDWQHDLESAPANISLK
jgi:putative proteasome-type protease